MERWQSSRVKTARTALDSFILRCDEEIAKLERQKAQAIATRKQLTSLEEFR